MMKYLWTILILLTMSATALAEDFVVSSDEYIVVSGNVSDTLGRTRLTPDSIRIVVTDSALTELHDAWYESADAQATLNGDVISFSDQWNDINGAASVGIFSLMVTIASDGQNNIDLFSNYNYTIRGVTVGVEQTFNEVGDILDTLQLQDDWVAQEASLFDPASDSVQVDVSTANSAGGLLASAADSVWEEVLTGATHNTATSAGRRLRGIGSDVITTGTAQRGGATYIVLASAESEADDFYKGHIIKIIAGTGLHQEKSIHDYTGSTDSITLHHGDNWITNPDGSSVYDIISSSGVEVIHMDDATLDSITEAVWDADTTGHTTGGTQGYANTHGTPASISAGDIVAIADTIFHRDSSDVNDGDATSFGTLLMKAAYVQGGASGLTAEEIADAVLDSIEVGTRSPSYVSVVVNNPSGDAVQFTSSGSNGDGLQITGNGTGDGIKAIGGSSSGSGFRSTGFGTGHGFIGQGGATGHGWTGIGGANGSGMFLRGVGTGRGLRAEAIGTGDAVSFVVTAGDGDGLSITGNGSGDGVNIVAGATGIGFKVAGGSSSGTGFDVTSTSGHAVRFFAGGGNGHGLGLSGSGTGNGLNATGGATADGLLATGGATSGHGIHGYAPVTGDGIRGIGGGSGRGLDVQGGATGDGARFLGGATSGAGIRATTSGTNDTGFVAQGIGTGGGVSFRGGTNGAGLFVLGRGSGAGVSITGGVTSTGGLVIQSGATTGTGVLITGQNDAGMKIISSGGNGDGLEIVGNGTGSGIFALSGLGATGDGARFVAISTNGNGLKLIGNGTGEEITSADLVDAIWSEDSAGYTGTEMAFLASQTGASGSVTDAAMGAIADSVWDKAATDARANAASVGKYILDSLQAILDSVQVGGGLDTLSDAYRDALLAIMNDTIELHHGTGDYGTGDGLDTLIYFAYDSVADAFIDGATINIKNTTTGSWVYTTTSAGSIIATLIDGATYYITANKSPGYIWPSIDTISSFSAATDSAYGYNTASTVISPVVGKTATVTVTVTRSDNTAYENVLVSAYLARSNVVDSAGRAIVNSIQRKRTDSNGRAQFTCMWSNYMIPATDWIFTVHKPASGGVSEAITIPTDSTTFNILFGTGQ